MVLKERIDLMGRLGKFFLENNQDWQTVKEKAYAHNPWFLPEYIDLAIQHIANAFLNPELLSKWVESYPSFWKKSTTPEVGIVMAGNIPLVGFHDFLSVFISGCRQKIKLSSKDAVLWEYIIKLLQKWAPETSGLIRISEQLKNCDAYIATGSNNTARYFEYYFAKYPHIIRRNRSSIALLRGNETEQMLSGLCDDVCLYFGLGCRNVTQLIVPEGYDFKPMEKTLEKYTCHLDLNRYKNNYDYQLALALLNKINYQSLDPVLLISSTSIFAPISVLHYQEYKQTEKPINDILSKGNYLQCIFTGEETIFGKNRRTNEFGTGQFPLLNDYADQVNTLSFLNTLKVS